MHGVASAVFGEGPFSGERAAALRERLVAAMETLGADRSRIRSLVVWHGMRLAIAGVVIGIGAAFGLTRFIASFLFGVKTWDPMVFVTVPVILSFVALLAVWMPATRASRLDPQQASVSNDGIGYCDLCV